MPETTTNPKTIQPDLRATGAALVSVGMSVPDHVLSNEEVAEQVGVTAEWIEERTGIKERRTASEGEDLMQFAVDAASKALEQAGVGASDIDLILFATTTYTEIMPGAAPVLAERLGAESPNAMDIGAACNGFVAALDMATAQVESGRTRNALVVGADLMRSIVDVNDRTTASVFGDGAGASVVTAIPGASRVSKFSAGADGSLGHLVTASQVDRVIKMKGQDTFRAAVQRLSESTLQAIAAAGLQPEDIDLFVYHQANRRILQAVGEEIGLRGERVIDCIESYGNSSAATVPIALAEAQATGELNDGDVVLIGAFGGGLLWGATVVEWGRETPPDRGESPAGT